MSTIKPYLTLLYYRRTHLLLYTSVAITGVLLGLTYTQSWDNIPLLSAVGGPLIVLLLTIGAYTFNDVMDSDLDKKIGKKRPLVTGKATKTQAMILASFAYILAFCLTNFVYNFQLMPVLLVGSMTFLGIAYSYPKGSALGDMLILKNLSIAVFYTSMFTLGLGAVVTPHNQDIPDSFVGVIVILGAMIFIGSMLSDVKDVEGDRAFNRRTIPVVLGWTKPKGEWFNTLYDIWFLLYFMVDAIIVVVAISIYYIG